MALSNTFNLKENVGYPWQSGTAGAFATASAHVTAIGTELHSDQEAALLEDGSRQPDAGGEVGGREVCCRRTATCQPASGSMRVTVRWTALPAAAAGHAYVQHFIAVRLVITCVIGAADDERSRRQRARVSEPLDQFPPGKRPTVEVALRFVAP